MNVIGPHAEVISVSGDQAANNKLKDGWLIFDTHREVWSLGRDGLPTAYVTVYVMVKEREDDASDS